MFPYFYFDPTMIILLPGILLALYAQYKVKSTYFHYTRVTASSGVSGAEVARKILNSQGLDDTKVEMIRGELSDHYDPRTNTVRLSPAVYQGNSLSSLGIAAHETGHAVQHATGYLPLGIRNSLVPIVNFSSHLAFPLFFIGLLFSFPGLLRVGIYLFAAVVLFQLITLPVEFNASSRALAMLQNQGFLESSEVKGTRAVLSSAAWTYVAAALVGLLNLLRLLVLSGAFRRRND
ncbi:MAG: zinc metallopeptidase [Peptococcia bacterium]